MWRQNLQSLQCDAAHIPLADESVDLIVTSPPYFSLRDYRENGESLKGQVGNEPSPEEFLASLWKCTEEWTRVLKSRGSIFVNLGDKWAGGGGGPPGGSPKSGYDPFPVGRGTTVNSGARWGFRGKSLMNIPHRYAIGCTDQLGLIEREEIVWYKANGLPESVRDRCRRSHEMIFHFTKEPVYYSAIDRIREDQITLNAQRRKAHKPRLPGREGGEDGMTDVASNPLGKLPPSVWDIALHPLNVPKYDEDESLDGTSFEFDHFAAYPPELVQRIILGFSPKDVCTRCGQGRFPVTSTSTEVEARRSEESQSHERGAVDQGRNGMARDVKWMGHHRETQIIGNVCACTPFTDHKDRQGRDWRGPEAGDRSVVGQHPTRSNGGTGDFPQMGGAWGSYDGAVKNEYGRSETREYHLDRWEPAPTVPGTVLDPFGGTGTSAITAAKLSRRGITCDLSYDYAKHLVEWRAWDMTQNKRK